MYLVDTSVWIDHIKGKQAEHVDVLDPLLTNPIAVGLSTLIYMEILQGAINQSSFDQFKQYFSGQHFYRFHDERYSYTSAAEIYFTCRRAGITLCSTVDCLFAQCAIENDLILLHHDRDFQQLASVYPDFRHQCFL